MKKHGWPELLHDYVEASMAREFVYGNFDCCLWAAGWVEIATGIDHASGLRGYDSKTAAYRVIARYGSIEKMVTHLLGRDPIHAAFAQRGDIVLIRERCALGGEIEMEAPEGLGICLGLHSAFPRPTGLMMIRTLEAVGAWKVD